jgi:hypothetical protein
LFFCEFENSRKVSLIFLTFKNKIQLLGITHQQQLIIIRSCLHRPVELLQTYCLILKHMKLREIQKICYILTFSNLNTILLLLNCKMQTLLSCIFHISQKPNIFHTLLKSDIFRPLLKSNIFHISQKPNIFHTLLKSDIFHTLQKTDIFVPQKLQKIIFVDSRLSIVCFKTFIKTPLRAFFFRV